MFTFYDRLLRSLDPQFNRLSKEFGPSVATLLMGTVLAPICSLAWGLLMYFSPADWNAAGEYNQQMNRGCIVVWYALLACDVGIGICWLRVLAKYPETTVAPSI